MVSQSFNRSNPLRLKRHSFKRQKQPSLTIPTMTNTQSDIIIPNPHEAAKPLTAPNLTHVVKLNPLNYTTWRFQLTNILFGLSLLGFLDGSNPTPAATVLDVNNQEIPNPAHLSWLKQDGLILGALMGTITAALQTLIVRAKTAKEAWDILAQTYANPSRVHIQQLKEKLDLIVKTTDQTITDYIHSIKACVDQLALLGKIIDPEDVVSKILKGLDYDLYKPVIDTVRARDTPISFEALHEKLLQHELLLHHNPSNNHYQPSANPAYKNNHHHRSYNRPSSHHYNHPQPAANPTNHPNPRPFKGRCQWCRETGHVVAHCAPFRKLFPNISFPAPPINRYQQPSANHVTMANNTVTPNPNYLLDSGASHHVTHDLDTLAFHSPYSGLDELLIGDGSGLHIANIGNLNFNSIKLNNVLHVPKISRNIISISQLCRDNQAYVIFSHDCFFVKAITTGLTLLQGRVKDGIYEWCPSKPRIYNAIKGTAPLSWHHRLGHPTYDVIKIINKNLPFSIHDYNHCESCNVAKSKKLPFSTSSFKTNAPLDLIFSDLWTSPVPSFDHYKYYIIFVDHYSKYVWLYPLKRKSDTTQLFMQFKALVEKYFNKPIKHFFSDNGGEYIKLNTTLLNNGISHSTSPPHTPEHNGYAERRHRHIVETGLALLKHAHLPTKYWPFAFSTATYLINRLPTRSLQGNSPYFMIHNQQPDYKNLHNFGCLCYPWLRPYTKHKLEDRSIPCVFVGYSTTQSAFHCLDPQTHRIYTSRHVKFYDDIYPFHKSPTITSPSPTVEEWTTLSIPILPQPTNLPSTSTTPQQTQPHHPKPPINIVYTRHPHSSSTPSIDPTTNSTVATTTQPTATSPATTTIDHTSSAPTHPSAATSHPPTPPPLPVKTVTTRLDNNIRKPNPRYATLAHVSNLTTNLPTTVKQALVLPHWRQAMQEEYDALTRNHTWTLVPRSVAQNIVGCKWVYRNKFNSDGTLKQHKARLVAKGFHQRPGIDYTETFSPVIKPTTVRLILSLAVTKNWPIRQLDVNNAFLQGTLTDNVFMAQPPGFVDQQHPDYVCKLNKAIYGLKQAPRAWYTELKSYLTTVGFTQSISDPSLFILHTNTTKLYMLIYVDDIIITGPNSSQLQTFITNLSNRFSLKDLGPLSYFLGIEVTPNALGIHLSQSKYINDLLTKHKMADAKPNTTPMATSPPLIREDNHPIHDQSTYRAIVGSLQYLSLTRPDIAFSINRLAQFLHHPTTNHWTALKRLLRYLQGTQNHGIQLYKNTPLCLHAFCDADFGGDKDTFLSTTGYIAYLGRNPIAWSSKKQKGIALSTTEAEFRAIASVTTETMWLRNLLSELHINVTNPPAIFCDNISATLYAKNPVFHSRMKHMAISFHYVKQQLQLGQIRLSHIASKDQIADILTKPLQKQQFHELRDKLGLITRTSNLRGHINNTSTNVI